MKGQQYRYRSRRKTTTGCGDCVVLIMRICKLDAKYPGVVQYSWGQFPIFALQCLRVALLAEIQDGYTTGLVWQKRGLNPPLSFITANLMIGDERSSRVSIVLFCPSRDSNAEMQRVTKFKND